MDTLTKKSIIKHIKINYPKLKIKNYIKKYYQVAKLMKIQYVKHFMINIK